MKKIRSLAPSDIKVGCVYEITSRIYDWPLDSIRTLEKIDDATLIAENICEPHSPFEIYIDEYSIFGSRAEALLFKMFLEQSTIRGSDPAWRTRRSWYRLIVYHYDFSKG